MPKYICYPNTTCETCGTPFHVYPHQLKIGKGRFCSNTCAWVPRRAALGTLEARLWSKVNRDGPIPALYPELGPCWEWLGKRRQHAYGVLQTHKVDTYTHRIAWEITNGAIPDGLMVCHRCDNPPCCNPSHLFIGSHDINMADKIEKGRHISINSRKLTIADVVEMRVRHEQEGIGASRLSRQYPVSRTTIDGILSRRSWKWLE